VCEIKEQWICLSDIIIVSCWRNVSFILSERFEFAYQAKFIDIEKLVGPFESSATVLCRTSQLVSHNRASDGGRGIFLEDPRRIWILNIDFREKCPRKYRGIWLIRVFHAWETLGGFYKQSVVVGNWKRNFILTRVFILSLFFFSLPTILERLIYMQLSQFAPSKCILLNLLLRV
jgi:hypothetical protein